MDALHYFHYGQLVHHGEATGDARVLAKSSGISDAFVELALSTAKVPALAGTVGVSWGMLRTKRGQPSVIARVEKVDGDVTIYQFIQMPSEATRELAGNLSALSNYLIDPLPSYEMLGDDLHPIQLTHVRQSTEEQVDNLLNLMSYARNNTRNIDPLIAAVISGTTLIVVNAPQDGVTRMEFIQGLLTLLPSSTRLGVTFLAHNTPDSGVSAQVMFMETAPEGDNHVVFDWESGTVSGKEVKNEYSRFVTSQMRLDPELVTRETEKLTPTAGWRFNSGDSLAEALDYASHRAKVDQSIQNSMPVEVASVAKILAEDPTLTDDQRLMYSRHLINFSLALDDLQYVDSVTATMHQYREIEDEVYKYMSRALDEGQGAVIFETLVRWNDNPFSPTGPKWSEMLAKSALAELDELVKDKDDEMVSEFLDDINRLGRQATSIIGRVIDRVLPLAEKNADIPPKILLMAISNLDETKLQALMNTPRFVKPLSTDVKRLLALYAQPDRNAPPGTLIRAVASMDAAVRKKALIAFVKQAHAYKRIDLIDERVLSELVDELNVSPEALDAQVVSDIANQVQEQSLRTLKRPAPRLLLQLLVLSKNYEALSTHMVAQSRDIYRSEGQLDYILSIQETFANITIELEDMMRAVSVMEGQGIGEVPIAAAILGALEGSSWHREMQKLADKVIRDAATSQRLLEVLPPQCMFNLLQFQARQPDSRRLRVAARLMGSCAAYDRSKVGLSAANRAYRLLDSNKRTQPVAIEVVRQYVREAQEKPAKHMIKFYGDRLGKDIGKRLQMSYEFSNLLARLDWMTYANWLQFTVDLLQSAVDAYNHKDNRPNLSEIRLLVDRVRRSTSVGRHQELAQDLERLTHNIVALAQRHDKHSSTSDRHYQSIATGSSSPKSVLDVYRAAGGYLLEKKPYPFRVKEGKVADPFADLESEELITSVTLASTLLNDAANVRNNNRNIMDYDAIVDEIESQTSTLIGNRADDLRQMGRNWQRLADLIVHIVKTSDAKVLEPGSPRGRKLELMETDPENVLELFRFIYGHFGR